MRVSPETGTPTEWWKARERCILAVNPPISTPPLAWPLKVENTRPNIRLLPPTHLPLPIEIPNRLRQRPRHIRPLPLQHIPHLMRRRNIALPPLQRPRDAQQSHQIGIIRMEILPRIRPINPHFVNLPRILA